MDQLKWIWKRITIKYYNYHLYLVPTDESTCSSESKAEPHNESLPHEMFFAKEKKTFWYL